jgi:pyridoxal biosynthesis lyase PdxS
MDVVTTDQAKIAEDVEAAAVMALERVSADMRAWVGLHGVQCAARTRLGRVVRTNYGAGEPGE